ncbi:MAG: ABC transporter ATP-binding protein [Deinococcus sp.]|nr:ABC transporter ATP-binding protein [Deinococcus sp.]
MIQVEHLTKRYGPNTAVQDLSFQVAPGEILGLLGPNGAGKTTTLRVLAGFLPATEGKVQVAGFDVFEQPMEVKRRIGYLPELPPLYPEMSVEGYLGFVARLKRLPPRQVPGRIDAVLEQCSLGEVQHRLLGRLSKGYRQRVGLAQVLIHDPPVLILDEPTAGLDPRQILEVRQLIKSLGGSRTIILSTHILPEVSATCGRVVIINRGQVVAVDTPENLSRRRTGAERLLVRIDGPADQVKEALGAVPGVAAVQEEISDGVTGWQVEGPGDLGPALAREVVQRGWGLRELRPLTLSLEDIFIELTTAEPSAEGEEVAA